MLEDREAEEVLLCPPKTKSNRTKRNNAFSKSAFNGEMKSTPGRAFRGEQAFGRQRS